MGAGASSECFGIKILITLGSNVCMNGYSDYKNWPENRTLRSINIS